jgi:adenosylmethionine-8-amino-7-oxononanoate aminotransferase/SAM-dependent methyltransferase
MSDEPYWGPFAELLRTPGVVEEAGMYEATLAPFYDALHSTVDDLPEYLELARRAAGPVLELGCGTGRVLLPLVEAGHRVVGVDLSADMLAVLGERLDALSPAARARAALVHADATRLRLGRRFPLVILPACSVALFAGEGRRALFRAVAAHLAEEGTFAFDYPYLAAGAEAAWDGEVATLELAREGRSATVRVGVRMLAGRSALLSNTHWRLPRGDGTERHLLEHKRVSVIDPERLEAELAECGLVVVERRTASTDAAGERRLVRCALRAAEPYPLWHPYQPAEGLAEHVAVMVEGRGCQLRDRDGRRYLDLAGGLWSAQCGLGHPAIVEAVEAQLRRLSCGPLFVGRGNEPALELARALTAMAPAPLPWAYLTGSGSEAAELAIKLARLHFHLRGETERKEVLCLDRSYHGTFFGSMAISGLCAAEAEPFAPGVAGVSAVPAPLPSAAPPGTAYAEFALECARALERRLAARPGRVAAFVAEPVLGSAGVVVPPPEYFAAVQRACREHGVLLVVDEVATGFGRTGRWFASEHFGLRPDLLLLSKGITSGYLPLGAVLFSAEVGRTLTSHAAALAHGSSQNGNPACCAAALATLDVLRRERLVERAGETGAYFLARLRALRRHPVVRDVRGLGLMLGVELAGEDGAPATPAQTATVYAALKHLGVLAYPAPSGLTFMPALTITEEEIDFGVECLETVLAAVRFGGGDAWLTGPLAPLAPARPEFAQG